MSKLPPLSYSAIKTFMTCPRQFKHKYTLKDVKDEGNDASRYGTEVHKAIEDYLRDGVPIPEKFRLLTQGPADAVKRMPGVLHVERKMALNAQLEPCDFFAKDCFIRGVADVSLVDKQTGRVLDWKTGKNAKFADPKQLELMALMKFKHDPQLQTVLGGLAFLVPDMFIKSVYRREDEKEKWRDWFHLIRRIEIALERDTFGPSPNNLCRKYCPVLTCEHNGRMMA